ncbi:hypothetical protein [Curvibacter sp. PAE-UM]|uniref:hypothetical protein n=1 Tax=Curvibacter sp. PAE-UM TaxID=1714344 RepID=UPI00070BD45B|nr:hypothetical protein [Curvibacter sp. PAE-UM]KRI00218.1 hypothetical protein AO057_13640 [Curvibacter sp. PAE-UM]
MDEQYFLVLLGQIATSPHIEEKLAPGGQIDRTLSRAPALDEKLLQALSVDEETGRVLIRPEHDRVERVVRKMATGLFVLRYGWAPAQEHVGPVAVYPYNVIDQRPLPYFIATFTERFQRKRWRTVQSGVFSYVFVRDPRHNGKVWCMMDMYKSLWAVVHFPNPKSKKARLSPDRWLFSELAERTNGYEHAT